MSGRSKLLSVALSAALVSAGGVFLLTSDDGKTLIKSHEGLRYVAYPDPGTGGKPWTICFGHTKGVYPGMTATHAQCLLWLDEDLAVAEAGVRRLIKVPLTQGQWDALVSFVFNVGESKAATSTLVRLHNAGQHEAACNQYPRWIYANKRVLNGLKKRRYEEKTVCLTPSPIIYWPQGKPNGTD